MTYAYDDNDRLLVSWKIIGQVDDGVNLETDDTTTTYGYTGTRQTSKTIKETYSTQTLVVVDYEYNLQGRMSQVVMDTYDSNGDVVKKETTTYKYNGSGIRVASTHKVEVDDDQNPSTALVTTSETETDYLIDERNHTGYQQIIEQITRNAGTSTVTDAKVFTLGHDVIDQTTFTPGNSQAGSPYTFMYDGHGSTRALLDASAAFVQHYAYTAYGMAIGFDEAAALTAILYSGEYFDAKIGLQNLRARWYDPNSGRFNRLDPFSGNLRDPQSLHKYLYAHGDPVNGIDPTGNFLAAGMVGTAAAAASIGTSFAGRGARLYEAGKELQVFFGRYGVIADSLTTKNTVDFVSQWLSDTGHWLTNEKPSFAFSMIPVLGPLRSAIYNFSNGSPWWGTFDLAMATIDFFTLGGMTVATKGIIRSVGSIGVDIATTGGREIARAGGTLVKKVGNYYVKSVDDQATGFMKWFGRTSIEEQVRALTILEPVF